MACQIYTDFSKWKLNPFLRFIPTTMIKTPLSQILVSYYPRSWSHCRHVITAVLDPLTAEALPEDSAPSMSGKTKHPERLSSLVRLVRTLSVVICLCCYFKPWLSPDHYHLLSWPGSASAHEDITGGDGLFTTILGAASFGTLLTNILVEPVENF